MKRPIKSKESLTKRTQRFVCLGLALLASINLGAETLTLKDAFSEALQSNPNLLAAKQAVKEAEAGLNIADSGFYPNLNASAGYSEAGNLTNVASTTAGSYSAGLQANWNLFNGFGTMGARAQSEEVLGQSKAAYDVASSSLLVSLWQAFNQLLFDQVNAGLLEDIRQRYHEDTLYEDLEFKSGQTARWTFLKSQSDEAQVKWQEDQNTLTIQADQASLAAMLGRDPTKATDLVVEGLLSATAAPDDDKDALAAVGETHPSLIQEKAVVAADDAAVELNEASRYPSLTANGSYNTLSADNWEDSWSAGLSVNFNLFAGGADEASITQAKAVLAAAQETLSNLRMQLQVSLHKAWVSYISDTQHVPLTHLATLAGEERYKTVGKLYEAGLAQYLDYEQAEEIYTSAQQDELSANLNAVQAQAQYENALGRTLSDALAELSAAQ
jgi:outer membrane protein TolC